MYHIYKIYQKSTGKKQMVLVTTLTWQQTNSLRFSLSFSIVLDIMILCPARQLIYHTYLSSYGLSSPGLGSEKKEQ